MLSEPQREYLNQHLRPMQIIVGALAAGAVTFMCVAPFVVAGRREVGPANPLVMQYTGLALTFLAILAWMLVPWYFAGGLRQAIADGKPLTNRPMVPAPPGVGDVQPLKEMYMTRLILGAAILEGAAFFNVVAYILERQPISLVVAGVLVILLLAQMPTWGRMQGWAESDLATLKQLRAMGSQHDR